jgi:hypothetical protein
MSPTPHRPLLLDRARRKNPVHTIAGPEPEAIVMHAYERCSAAAPRPALNDSVVKSSWDKERQIVLAKVNGCLLLGPVQEVGRGRRDGAPARG